MKVLMVQDTYLPRLGGAEVHVAKLSRALEKLGHQVTVATATPGPPRVHGMRVFRFPGLEGQGKRAILSLPRNAPPLAWLIQEHDVVHGHYTAMCSAVAGAEAKVLGRPFIVTLHGFGTLDSSATSPLPRLWRRLAFSLADAVVATSDEMADVARRFTDDSAIVKIPNGVDTNEFAPSPNQSPGPPIRVATVRRLVSKNGVQYLIQAAPRIARALDSPIEFLIVGDGPLRRQLEGLAAAKGIASKVRFVGALPNDQIRGVLEGAHVVVFPSSAESTSIAALEAMSLGKPIVASAVGGYPELLGASERGVLVRLFDRMTSDYDAPLRLPEDRIGALTDAVVELLQDPVRAIRLGTRARQYVVEHHDWLVIARRLIAIYERLMAAGCSRRRCRLR